MKWLMVMVISMVLMSSCTCSNKEVEESSEFMLKVKECEQMCGDLAIKSAEPCECGEKTKVEEKVKLELKKELGQPVESKLKVKEEVKAEKKK